MLEARASRDGLILARQQGEQKVILETDCLELVNLWKKDSQRSIIDPILKEIESIVLAFQEFAFVFVKHCCNKIAHVLACKTSHEYATPGDVACNSSGRL